uniref:Uncharacterized protein n=1 Tax=Cacopsylla melanoneura TaxID=428564 RepID=A0A8D8V1X9_9HEMI
MKLLQPSLHSTLMLRIWTSSMSSPHSLSSYHPNTTRCSGRMRTSQPRCGQSVVLNSWTCSYVMFSDCSGSHYHTLSLVKDGHRLHCSLVCRAALVTTLADPCRYSAHSASPSTRGC